MSDSVARGRGRPKIGVEPGRARTYHAPDELQDAFIEAARSQRTSLGEWLRIGGRERLAATTGPHRMRVPATVDAITDVAWSAEETRRLEEIAARDGRDVGDVVNRILSRTCWSGGDTSAPYVPGAEDVVRAAEIERLPLAVWIRLVVGRAIGIDVLAPHVRGGARAIE